jgi:hypothetical protein
MLSLQPSAGPSTVPAAPVQIEDTVLVAIFITLTLLLNPSAMKISESIGEDNS